MNNRRAKQTRRQAKGTLYQWYLSLLEEDQQKELTPELAVQFTPVVSYWNKKHERTDKDGKEYISIQRHISEHTQRWFIKKEKKTYGVRHISSAA